MKWLQLNSQSTPLEKVLNALAAYKQIDKKAQKSSIDTKLIEMLDVRMRKCFQLAKTEDKQQLDQQTSVLNRKSHSRVEDSQTIPNDDTDDDPQS